MKNQLNMVCIQLHQKKSNTILSSTSMALCVKKFAVMKTLLFVFVCLTLVACSKKNDLSIICEGDLDKSFIENNSLRHEPTPNMTYFYRFEDDKVFKNHYEYGFPCSLNNETTIKCIIDLTLGDGSVTTITVDKKSLLVTDNILRKAPKNPSLPYSENFSGKCKPAKLP